MVEEALLERIRNLERKAVVRGSRDIFVGVRSVMSHLRKLLNTRQGSVPIADDYGMPDLTNFPGEDLPAAADELQEIIQNVIQKYEPRLGRVKVFFDPKPGEVSELRFKLEWTISQDRSSVIPVVLETVISADGIVRIEE
jgi:type VI secretion system protein